MNARAIIERLTRDDAIAIFAKYGVPDADHLSADSLKTAWKKLAQKHHPDLGGNLAAMQAINTAYDELKGTPGFGSRGVGPQPGRAGAGSSSAGAGTGHGQGAGKTWTWQGLWDEWRDAQARVELRRGSPPRLSPRYWLLVRGEFAASTDFLPTDVRKWWDLAFESQGVPPPDYQNPHRPDYGYWFGVESAFVNIVLRELNKKTSGTSSSRKPPRPGYSFAEVWKEAKYHIDDLHPQLARKKSGIYWAKVVKIFVDTLAEKERPELRFTDVMKIWREVVDNLKFLKVDPSQSWYWPLVEKRFLNIVADTYGE